NAPLAPSATSSQPAVSSTNDESNEPKSATPALISSTSPSDVRGGATTVEAKSVQTIAEKPAPKKIEPTLNPKAAQFKQHIEQAIAERGLTGKAQVQGTNNTLTLSGKLHPMEHGALLKLLRNAPAEVRIVDHIEYDDTPVAAASAGASSSGASGAEDAHPVPSAGSGAIHVVTDVIGASAILHGPRGRALAQC